MSNLDLIEQQAVEKAHLWLNQTAGTAAPTPDSAATPDSPATTASASLPTSPEEMADLIRQAAAIPPEVIRTAMLLEEISHAAAAELSWAATAPDALRAQAVTLIVEHLSSRVTQPREHLILIVNALTGEAGALQQIASTEKRA